MYQCIEENGVQCWYSVGVLDLLGLLRLLGSKTAPDLVLDKQI